MSESIESASDGEGIEPVSVSNEEPNLEPDREPSPDLSTEPSPDRTDEAFYDDLSTPEFHHGMDVGISMGTYEANERALNAWDAGEIALFIEYIRPKTCKEWQEFEIRHGDLSSRWKRDASESLDRKEDAGENPEGTIDLIATWAEQMIIDEQRRIDKENKQREQDRES